MKLLTRSLLACSLLTFAACGGASAAGHYEIDKEAFKAGLPGASKMPAEMLDKMLSSMTGSLHLQADQTATMAMKMPPMMDMTANGTWKLDGSKLTLTLKDKDGKEESEVADYAGGAITLSKTEGGETMKMVFRRK